MMNRKGILALIGIIFCSIVIHSYINNQKKTVEFPAVLYGIPTYANSRANLQMSALNSDPYIAVFLSQDPAEKVIAYYKENLKGAKYHQLKYGGTNIVMTIHQFQLKKGRVRNFIHKGVEIIEYNDFNSRVFNARTKIKIYVPQSEIAAETNKQETPPPTESTQPAENTEPTTPPETTEPQL